MNTKGIERIMRNIRLECRDRDFRSICERFINGTKQNLERWDLFLSNNLLNLVTIKINKRNPNPGNSYLEYLASI